MTMEFRRLIIFVLGGLVLIFACDMLAGLLLQSLYGRMKGGERARAHSVITRPTAEVLIMGSSRALHHYVPAILQDSLGCKVTNAGRPAQTMLYHLAVLEMVLERNKPRLVILDINEDEFVFERRKHDLINVLLPYYRTDSILRKHIDRINPGFKWFRWSHLLPYNSSIVAIVYRSLFGTPDAGFDNGFIPKIGQKISTLDTLVINGTMPKMDSAIVNAFRQFVKTCKDNNIRLLAFVSPRFQLRHADRPDLEFVKREVSDSGILLFDFSSDGRFIDNQGYRYDVPHLNLDGAKAYSREVAHLVKYLNECH